MTTKTEILRCILDETEIAERGRRLARLTQDVESATSRLAAAKAAAKAQAPGLIAVITTGAEERPVEVEVRLDDPAPGRATEVRTDTCVVLRERRMTPDELKVARAATAPLRFAVSAPTQ